MIIGPKKRYSLVERHCLALVFVAQKLRHYLLAFWVHIITRCDPIKFLLAKTVLMGRATRWFLILSEYELKCISPKAIKSQALANLLAYFPSRSFDSPIYYIRGDELQENVCQESEEWVLEFDESSLEKTGGAWSLSLMKERSRCSYSNWISPALTTRPSISLDTRNDGSSKTKHH